MHMVSFVQEIGIGEDGQIAIANNDGRRSNERNRTGGSGGGVFCPGWQRKRVLRGVSCGGSRRRLSLILRARRCMRNHEQEECCGNWLKCRYDVWFHELPAVPSKWTENIRVRVAKSSGMLA